MGEIKFIFCEGGAESYDRKVLEKILRELPSYPIVPLIIPAGGKTNLPNFMLGFLHRGSGLQKKNNENAIGFRDRDFDAPVPETPQLVIGNNPKIYFSHRATIENYLLSPETLFRFVQEKEIAIGISSIEDAGMVFQEEAEKLKYYSAARHSLGAVRQRINLGTTWTEGSGILPESLSQEDCLREAFRIVENVQNMATSMPGGARALIGVSNEDDILTSGRFEQVFNFFCGKFDEQFFGSKQFMVWFHAKDLQKAISQREEFLACQFSFKNYYKFVLQNFDYGQFPDLVQFRLILEA